MEFRTTHNIQSEAAPPLNIAEEFFHKKVNITSVFEAGKKEELQNYSLSDSPQPLGTQYSKDSWKPF